MAIVGAGTSGGGRPPVDSEAVTAPMERPVLSALDAFAADQPGPAPGRPDAVRRALAERRLAKGCPTAAAEG